MKSTKKANRLGLCPEYPPSLLEWHDWEIDFFNSSPVLVMTNIRTSTPVINVKETDAAFIVEVAAPEMEKKDFNVFVESGLLTISSQRKNKYENKEDQFTTQKISYSFFQRSFKLPENVNVEKIAVKHEKDILKIALPKVEAEGSKSKTKSITLG